ncbi:uncharacterized protein METZ01_LOCUS414348 [marine metagenome]|uniref:Uncharacterized protein n=1 Tax=marine metagenome TaxID=408172 RepID=A0A382WS75_9ZZZZ
MLFYGEVNNGKRGAINALLKVINCPIKREKVWRLQRKKLQLNIGEDSNVKVWLVDPTYTQQQPPQITILFL